MMTLLIALILPLDTARFWVSPPATGGHGFLSSNPASLASIGRAMFYAEGGWRDGLVPGPAGVGFRITDIGTFWLDAGAQFVYSSEKKHLVRDDTSDIDTITQKTILRFYALRLAFCQSRGPLSYGAEALGALGALSDDFSSATGTIFPDDIIVSSSPLAYGGGAGVALDMGLVSVEAHGRYWPDFISPKRDFQGDSLNSFVLRETVIPDSLEGGLPIEIGIDIASRPLGVSGEFLYRGETGGLLAYERVFGTTDPGRGGHGLSVKLAGGWMGAPLFLGKLKMAFGKLGLGLRGGYWGGIRAGGFVFYGM